MDNVPRVLAKRARLSCDSSREVRNKLYLNDSFISRLSQETELVGHKGCVNCLEWASNGMLLASGSDDLTVRLWNPMTHKEVKCLNSGHRSNIFSVKFIENTNNQLIASAAADGQVRVHNVEVGETLNVFGCHRFRVKRLCTSPVAPSLLWSAGEDGTVRVIDLREAHTCGATSVCNNICINLNGENISNGNQLAEAKCLDICPTNPYIAVGSSDQFVRLFDIRKLRLCSENFLYTFGACRSNEPAAIYCVPGHISHHKGENQGSTKGRMGLNMFRSINSTFVTFNKTGTELLVNLGSEQIYLFDLDNYKHSFRYSLPQTRYEFVRNLSRNERKVNSSQGDTKNQEPPGSAASQSVCKNNSKKYSQKIQSEWLALKEKANAYFHEDRYMEAIACYSRLIQLTSYNSHIIFANRALALMKRKWSGDVYAALLDLRSAIQIDPTYTKAHLRLIKCLLEFEWLEEAYSWSLLLYQYLDSIRDDSQFIQQHEQLKSMTEKSSKSNASSAASTLLTNDDDISSPPDSPHFIANQNLTQQEFGYQSKAIDFKSRYCGHCNAATDIKEANFFGANDGQYIMAGSDDGSFFIWDKSTTNLLRVMVGDASIVNCLQPNPQTCLLATSGIDDSIKLWSPGRPNVENPYLRSNLSSVASSNQKRLNQDPIETFFSFASMTGARFTTTSANSSDDEDNHSNEDDAMPETCRTS